MSLTPSLAPESSWLHHPPKRRGDRSTHDLKHPPDCRSPSSRSSTATNSTSNATTAVAHTEEGTTSCLPTRPPPAHRPPVGTPSSTSVLESGFCPSSASSWPGQRSNTNPTRRASSNPWSQFVTTDRFLAGHLVGSILGQAIYLLGAIALAAAIFPTTRRPREAVTGIALAVLGSAGLLAGFGTAAFAQPAIGRLELAGGLDAQQLYDDVIRTPAMITLLAGAVLFAVSTVLLARAAAAAGAERWATVSFGASGPLIGIVGVAVGEAQTVGALAAVIGGVGLGSSVPGHPLDRTQAPPVPARLHRIVHLPRRPCMSVISAWW